MKTFKLKGSEDQNTRLFQGGRAVFCFIWHSFHTTRNSLQHHIDVRTKASLDQNNPKYGLKSSPILPFGIIPFMFSKNTMIRSCQV